jgi:PAS domain S-box-containing protein
VSQTVKMDLGLLTRMLEGLPGAAFCSRMDPATGKSAWLYVHEKMAELHDMPDAEMRADPLSLAARVVPEDRARLDALITQSAQGGVPFSYLGKIVRTNGEIRWLETHATVQPEPDGSVLWYGQAFDVTDRKQLEADLRARNDALGASEATNANLIERLRYSIDELSNPILEVWDDVLVMPIIGVVDSRRTADMVQRLLAEVTRTQASFVIIDLTGVEIVDTKTADHLMKLMRKVEIVGARCVLTGIRAAVAETLVDIGVDFGRLVTLRNLKHGLREALRSARSDRQGMKDLEVDDEPAGEAPARRRGR